MHNTQVVEAVIGPHVPILIIVALLVIFIPSLFFRRGMKALPQTFPVPTSRSAPTPPPCPPPQSTADPEDYVLPPFDPLPLGLISHKSITFPSTNSSSLVLTQDTILVANDFIKIERNIEWPLPLVWNGNSRPANLTMICVGGTITISGLIGVDHTTGSLAPCKARSGAAVTSSTLDQWITGNDGQPGGSIFILASKVVIDGVVQAQQGGFGGAVNVTAPAGSTKEKNFCAGAAGAAGSGGDVVICVAEGLSVDGYIISGSGEEGGDATIAGADGCDAYSLSGRGSRAGSIYLRSLSQIKVEGSGQIYGGHGGCGGKADATGGNGPAVFFRRCSGGDGFAKGADGENGGSVITENVSAPMAHGGPGGDGGEAEAFGGNGSPGTFWGWEGGDARADGGDGAADGLPPLATPDPTVHASHEGGSAQATAGAGGKGWKANGDSGEAHAQGGWPYGGQAPAPDDIPAANAAPVMAKSP